MNQGQRTNQEQGGVERERTRASTGTEGSRGRGSGNQEKKRRTHEREGAKKNGRTVTQHAAHQDADGRAKKGTHARHACTDNATRASRKFEFSVTK